MSKLNFSKLFFFYFLSLSTWDIDVWVISKWLDTLLVDVYGLNLTFKRLDEENDRFLSKQVNDDGYQNDGKVDKIPGPVFPIYGT